MVPLKQATIRISAEKPNHLEHVLKEVLNLLLLEPTTTFSIEVTKVQEV